MTVPLDAGAPVEGPTVAVASLAQRLGGVLIDGLLTSMVVVVPVLLGIVHFDSVQDLRISPGWAAALLVFGAVYTIVPTALWGQTAGKLAVGSRVVVEADGSVPGWRRSLLRWFVAEGVGQIPYIGIWISLVVIGSLLFDSRRRGLHDKAAGTIVVRASRPAVQAGNGPLDR
ncbi:MAG TPA: RDD family protein [Acidimicrobiales bacterium]|jgi:uncharacterized RDD family membrane protein YckC|nr:RDD family protein [Acidimicrobiales bacterium]